jgi:DNA polymerase-3 subunit epsilon
MISSGAPDAPGARAPAALSLPALASLPLEHCRFAVVDVETSGARFERGGRIVELAVAILEGGTIHLAWHALVDPGTPIPPWVTRLTGITDGLVAGRPGFADVAPGLGRALEAGMFVAHNAPFDWRFVAAECALAGVPAPTGAPLCTVRLTRRLVPELRHRSLDDVARFFEITNPARHRAFGDALATAGVLRGLLVRARERGVTTLEELMDLYTRPRHRPPRAPRVAGPAGRGPSAPSLPSPELLG